MIGNMLYKMDRIFLALTLFFSAFVSSASVPKPCDITMSVDITQGVQDSSGIIVFEGVEYPPSQQFLHEGAVRGCPCSVKTCIRKCCPKGHVHLTESKSCVISSDPMVNPFKPTIYDLTNPTSLDFTNTMAVLYELPCQRQYVMNPYIDDVWAADDQFYLQRVITTFDL